MVNNRGLHGVRTRTGSIDLEAGDAYPILIYFGENGGGDVIEVKFKVPGSSNFTFNGEGIFFESGSVGEQTLLGGDGDDTIYVGNVSGIIDGGNGNDTIDTALLLGL